MKSINVLGRVLLVDGENLLVVRRPGHTFLPGGHVEYNESLKQAIKRECREELSEEVEVTDFVGILEHSFNDKNGPYHEINFIFLGKMSCQYPNLPKAGEKDLEVAWIKIVDLAKEDLVPHEIHDLIINREDYRGIWTSTME